MEPCPCSSCLWLRKFISLQPYMEDIEDDMEDIEEDIPKLPSEIICSEILPRLPAESLMRFRCVCRSWFDLFSSSPLFQRIHLKYHPLPNNPYNSHILIDVLDFGFSCTPTRHYFLFVKASQTGNTLSQVTDYVKLPHNFDAKYCVNGLVLGYSPLCGSPISLFNPFTRESISIPYPAGPVKHWIRIEQKYLGYSSRTNEYKIILAKQFEQEESRVLFLLKIYTLRTGVWRTLEVDWDALSLDPLHPWPLHRTDSVCVHGAIHLLIWLNGINRQCILAFDVADERITVITLAQIEVDDEDKFRMIEVDGCLALVSNWKPREGTLFDVLVLWILKDYENQLWIKETIYSYPPGLLHLYDIETRKYRMTQFLLPELIRTLFFCSFSTSLSPCIVPLT